MQLLATHTVPHPSGDKEIRLYHGDLTKIPPGEEVDLLVVSAFPNDYSPTPTSLIGALYDAGISVHDLAKDKEVDLRTPFSSWLSRDLGKRFPAAGFRRILCFESDANVTPPEAVGNIFRALMPFALGDPPIRSVAMPVLAAGNQGYDAAVMLQAIFQAATHWLGAGLPMQTVKLVVYDKRPVDRLRTVFEKLSAPRASAASLAGSRGKRKQQYDYFVSYAHDDTPLVDGLVIGLKAANPGLHVFQDKLELNVGQSWQDELDRALESCRSVVAVFSPSYLRSKVCIEEFNMARLRHRESDTPILRPIFLRDAPLPLYMRTLQYIDCREADKDRLAGAARLLASALGERAG